MAVALGDLAWFNSDMYASDGVLDDILNRVDWIPSSTLIQSFAKKIFAALVGALTIFSISSDAARCHRRPQLQAVSGALSSDAYVVANVAHLSSPLAVDAFPGQSLYLNSEPRMSIETWSIERHGGELYSICSLGEEPAGLCARVEDAAEEDTTSSVFGAYRHSWFFIRESADHPGDYMIVDALDTSLLWSANTFDPRLQAPLVHLSRLSNSSQPEANQLWRFARSYGPLGNSI